MGWIPCGLHVPKDSLSLSTSRNPPHFLESLSIQDLSVSSISQFLRASCLLAVSTSSPPWHSPVLCRQTSITLQCSADGLLLLGRLPGNSQLPSLLLSLSSLSLLWSMLWMNIMESPLLKCLSLTSNATVNILNWSKRQYGLHIHI
jgi:hypothetical protein